MKIKIPKTNEDYPHFKGFYGEYLDISRLEYPIECDICGVQMSGRLNVSDPYGLIIVCGACILKAEEK
jgi:hypothetical protein